MTGAVLSGLLKIAAVALVSAGIGGAVYFAAAGGDSEQSPPPQVLTTPVPPTEIAPPQELSPPSTKATASPPGPRPAVECPPDWKLFDNTLLHYTICYPPDWGLTRGDTEDALASVPEQDQTFVIIASPEWFPYPTGQEQVGADVLERLNQAIRIRLDMAPPYATFEGCDPSIPETISGLDARWCEDVYTITDEGRADFRPDGDTHAITVLIPLRSPKEPFGESVDDWRLHVRAVTRHSLYPGRADLLWQVIRSVRVY